MTQNTNQFDIEGTVIDVEPPKHLSDNFIVSRIIIQAWKDRYSEYIPFDFINRNSELTRDVQKGDKIMITFQVSGRQKTNRNNEKYYVSSLQGLNVTKL